MITTEELRQIPLLAELDEEELMTLSSLLEPREVKKGYYVFYAKDPGPSLMFVVSGEVRVTLIGEDGKEIVLATIEKGNFFGEQALLTGDDRSANVLAATDCTLFVLPREDFYNHILKNTGLSLALMRELAVRLRDASTKIGDLVFLDVYRRLISTLKTLAVKTEVLEEERWIIEKRPTHQELASMVGTSREMVTRALKELEDQSGVEIEGKKITFTDFEV